MRGISELLLCIDFIFLMTLAPIGESFNSTANSVPFSVNSFPEKQTQHTTPQSNPLLATTSSSEVSKLKNRLRRSNDLNSSEENTFEREEVEWTNIDEEVDIVIPKVLQHLQSIGVEYLQLPDVRESISVKPLFITYEAGLFLSNGIVYNIAGISRYGSANMTYEGKSFRTVFYLIINQLQFEYNFMLKLMLLEGYGKVIGSLDDTIIYADVDITMPKLALQLNDFRVVSFRYVCATEKLPSTNINVQLDQIRIVRELTGVILSPITNLFKERITTTISDKLRDQMQTLMDDFNTKDPLELRTFSKSLLGGLTGQSKEPKVEISLD